MKKVSNFRQNVVLDLLVDNYLIKDKVKLLTKS